MVCANCHRLIEYSDRQFNLVSNFDESAYYNALDQLANQNRKVSVVKEKNNHELPSREQLKQEIRAMSFCAIGRKYNVSDNSIRKWCIKMNLPSRVSDIKAISDEDWINI